MNLTPLIKSLSIRDKNSHIVPLNPNWAQQEFLDTMETQIHHGRPVRIIVLKARQLGLSTISQACEFALSFLYEGLQCLTIAHELQPSQGLLRMAQLFWDRWPYKEMYEAKYESQKNLAWAMGSSIKIMTASNVKSSRGSTTNYLHASEVAFWPKPEETMLALRQSIPNTPNSYIVLESTANGVGNYFHKTWVEAEAGENEFIPLFFPWHRHPEYLASAIGLERTTLGALDSDERALRAMGVSDDRLSWRRWAIKNLTNNDINQFHQEYPSSPEEAFIQSGTNVFNLTKLREVYDFKQGGRGRLIMDDRTGDVEFRPDSTGPLTIFKTPTKSDWGEYMIGGDPTGADKGDYACAQVINRRTLEQVAIWRGKIDPQSFADVLARLGKYYNWAMLVPEMTGPGYATVGRLTGLGYKNIYQHTRPESIKGRPLEVWGWDSNSKSKPLAIGTLNKYIVDGRIIIHDHETFKELSNYVVLPNGDYGPGVAADHDDTVMSLAIVVTAHVLEASQMPQFANQPNPDAYSSDKPTVAEVLEEIEAMPAWENWGDEAENG